MISINKYVQQIVEEKPTPPREYRLFDVVKIVICQPNVLLQSIIGIVLVLVIICLMATRKLHHVNDIYFIIAIFSFIILLPVAGLLHLIRFVISALKYGYIGELEFTESKRTLFGSVKWKCFVRTQLSNFEQTFTAESSWKDEAVKAKLFKAIVYPQKKKILFFIGIID